MSDSAKFCPMCGASAEEKTADEMKNAEHKTWDQSQSGGQPLYTQTAYGQAASGQSRQPAEPQKTNGFAIAGFVLSFFFAILGIIFSAIALKQISERNEGGHGLAVAGLVLSIVWIGLWLVLFSTGACAFTSLRFLI